jgi:hypothetical protein
LRINDRGYGSNGSGAVYPVLSWFGAWDGSGPAQARIDADPGKFVRLLCGGAEVDPANYTVTRGSTVVTLRESYLAAFAEGTHVFVAEYSDGRSGDITLVIGSSPRTGEDAGPFPAAATALAFLALPAFLASLAFLALPGGAGLPRRQDGGRPGPGAARRHS